MKPVVFLFKNRLRRENGKYRIDCGYRLFKSVQEKLKKQGIKAFLDGPSEMRHLTVDDDIHPIIVNWGCSSSIVKTFINDATYLNHPDSVLAAVNKIDTSKKLRSEGLNRLVYTTNKEEAFTWYTKGTIVFARTIVNGKSGEGIVVCNPKANEKYSHISSFPDAPLYTQYYAKTHEFRIHVISGVVVDRQQKRKMSEEKLSNNELTYDKMVRSWENGWVFTRENIKSHETMDWLATSAVNALGLNYGAVDILARYSSDGTFRDCVVCEVNTSPGMEGSTLDTYSAGLAETISQAVDRIVNPVEKLSKLPGMTEFIQAWYHAPNAHNYDQLGIQSVGSVPELEDEDELEIEEDHE